ncbi:MAG: tetratricopeptide repeat protein, partial [Deltaproteobacteria bacterium]|nr:tetratricopeptide repeat protein [Deltaproteobacteria bacterium]
QRLAIAFAAQPGVWQQVTRAVDRHASAWQLAADAACRARIAGEPAAAPRATCLAQRLAELREVTRAVGALEPAARRNAPVMARSLSPIADCADATYLAGLAAATDPARVAVRAQLAASRIGRPDLARAQQVLADARATGDPRLEAEAHVAVGRAQGDRDQLVAAVESYARAAASGDSKVRLEAWTRASAVLQKLGRLAEAAQLLDAAEEALRASPDALREAGVASVRGTLFGRRHEYPAAVERFSRSIALLDEIYGADSTAQTIDVRNLAIAMRYIGRKSDALAALVRVLEIDRAAFGPGDPEVGRDLQAIGALYSIMERPADALPYLEQARVILQKRSLDRAALDGDLGVVLWKLDRPGEAIAAFRDAVATRAELVPLAKETVDARARLATMLANVGKYEEAEREMQAVIAGRARLGAPGSILARDEVGLGEVLTSLGRHDEALAVLAKARAAFEEADKGLGPNVAGTLAASAAVERARGRYRAALELDERAARIRDESLPAGDLDRTSSVLAIAKDSLGTGDAARAKASAETALAVFEKSGPTWLVADARWTLARAAWEAGARGAPTLELARRAREAAARLPTVANLVPVADVDAWLAARAP